MFMNGPPQRLIRQKSGKRKLLSSFGVNRVALEKPGIRLSRAATRMSRRKQPSWPKRRMWRVGCLAGGAYAMKRFTRLHEVAFVEGTPDSYGGDMPRA